MYAKVMELNYWGSSECVRAAYDEKKGEWIADVRRAGTVATLKPKQLVFATGAYGPPNVIPLPGIEIFAGEHCHSSRCQAGAPFAGQSCIVVGGNSSAHDIAAGLWEYGAQVTMLQRSPTTVVRSETLMELGFESLYSESALEAGITTDKADLLFAATPFRIMHRGQIPIYEEIRRRDAFFYARLAKSGFKVDFGEDESGLMMKAMRTGSGYYSDVGASDLIAKGDIAVKSGVEIERVKKHSVELTDGSELAADLIVMATGFQSMNRTVAPIISEEVADKVGKCWGLGSGVPNDPGPWEGEPRNMWRPTQQPGLWFHGGNLHLSRHFSLVLALQIKAHGGPAYASLRAAARASHALTTRESTREGHSEEHNGHRRTRIRERRRNRRARAAAEPVACRNRGRLHRAHRAAQPDSQRVRVQGLRGRAA